VFAGDAGTRISAPISSAVTPGGWGTDEAQLWADAYADLADLQNRTGQFFAVPDDFTLGDARDVSEVLSLLNGAKVPLRANTVTVTVISEQALDLMTSAGRSGKFRLASKTESFALTLGNNRIELGPCVQVLVMDKVLNMKEARRALAEDGHARVRMHVDQTSPEPQRRVRRLPHGPRKRPRGDRSVGDGRGRGAAGGPSGARLGAQPSCWRTRLSSPTSYTSMRSSRRTGSATLSAAFSDAADTISAYRVPGCGLGVMRRSNCP
jgi:hypothetical protein